MLALHGEGLLHVCRGQLLAWHALQPLEPQPSTLLTPFPELTLNLEGMHESEITKT